ncbi:MAG: terminase [Candidatus Hydrogenedentes bacterium]|nr:terminase [Candidatus Hydrogenedentota bacterium]
MIPPVLYPYQLRYLRDPAKFKAAMFARQTGKTFTTTLEIVNHVLEGMAAGKPARWTIMSISKARALDAMDNGVKLHLQAYKTAFKAVEVDLGGDDLAFEVRLPGGSRIRAIAANATTARGMTENLFLDEFAFHKDSRAIWTALLPVVSRPELMLRIASTPNGKNNKFYEIMADNDGLFSRHTTDIYQAVADGLPRDIEMLRKAMKDPAAWAQEFECRFVDGGAAWLSFDIIGACESASAGNPALYAGQPCAVGMDIARRGDLTVITVLENIFGLWIAREIIELQNVKFSDQMAELARVMRQYRVVCAAIDQTGMGEKFVEDAKDLFGKERVAGILFTGPAKLNMATALKEAMEDRKLLIPVSVELRGDLHSVKRVQGASGAPRLVADRSEVEGSHADRFWSLALAVLASAGEVVDFSLCASAGTTAGAALNDYESTDRGWGTVTRVANGY